MTRLPLTHLNDEELALIADALMSEGEMGINPHLSSCEDCQQAVLEALRGLTVLALASDPPADIASHVRARRWAAAHDRSRPAPSEAVEDVAEVAGRGMDTDQLESGGSPQKTEPPDENG